MPKYVIAIETYYELEYDQSQDTETICQDFWDKYYAGELGQGDMYEIENIDEA